MQNAIERRLSDQLKQYFKEALFLCKNLLRKPKVVLNQGEQNVYQKNLGHSKHTPTILSLCLNRLKLQFFVSRLRKLVEILFVLMGNRLEVLL